MDLARPIVSPSVHPAIKQCQAVRALSRELVADTRATVARARETILRTRNTCALSRALREARQSDRVCENREDES